MSISPLISGFGFTIAQDIASGFRQSAAPLVLPTFEAETVDSLEFGIKADFYDGRARANIAFFDYTYENLQVQATDPDVFQGVWKYLNRMTIKSFSYFVD